jgi:hypothetical protein
MGFSFPGNPFVPPNPLVALVMLAWIPIVLYFFSRYPAQRAVVISFVVGTLFLPQAAMRLPVIGDYSKISATCYGVLIATYMYETSRLNAFEFSWIDVPATVWCICPMLASITNGLGPYDGFTTVLTHVLTWGLPYFIGRLYFNNLDGLRELAIGIFLGGLVYAPFCLAETRISPQLHRIFYGGHPFADFAQSMRMGGYRPTVFMHHGLAVGMFMMVATLVGIWLWQTKVLRKVRGIPMPVLVAFLLATFVLLKSSGAYVLLMFGIATLLIGRQLKTAILAFIAISLVCAYIYVSAGGNSDLTHQITEFLSKFFDEERMQSLTFRFENEEILTAKARERLLFGWAGWGRSLIYDANGKQAAIQDSLWILMFGQYGLVGLSSLFSLLLLPIASLFWRRVPASTWGKPEQAPTAVLAVALNMYVVDCLLNAMVNPIYVVVSGGIAGLVVSKPERLRPRTSQKLVRMTTLLPAPAEGISSPATDQPESFSVSNSSDF